MNRPTHTALKVAGIVLALSGLGGALTGCGGSDSDGGSASDASGGALKDASQDASATSDASTGASKDGFCEKFQGMYGALSQSDAKDPSAAIKSVKGWAAEMEEYGTPSEMSDGARDGAVLLIATFKGVDDDASMEDLQKLGSGYSAADNEKVDAFGTWVTENCAPDAPSDDAS